MEHYKQLVNVPAVPLTAAIKPAPSPALSKVGKFEQLLFLVFLFYGTGINSYNTGDLSLIVMSAIGLGYLFVVKKEKIDPIFFKVLAFWLVVNFFSWGFLGGLDFKISTLLGSIFKLTIGYVFIKIFQERFFGWFEKWVFVLAVVSLPFFMIQLYNPSILTKLPINFVAPERLLHGDWNGIVFNYQPFHVHQNSGFAGEPGTFGYYIGFALMCNLVLNAGKFTRRFWTLLAIGLTTVSTNFALSAMLFLALYLYNTKGLAKYVALVAIFPVLYIIFQLPFLGPKIDEMLNITGTFTEKSMIKWTRVNRFSYFVSQLKAVVDYPFGYGINENALLVKNLYGQTIEGTNGVSRIAVRFGVFGFVYFFVIFYKWFQRCTLGFKGALFLFLIITMYLAANPMERDYFITALFWMYFFVSREQLVDMQQRYAAQRQEKQNQRPVWRAA